MASCCQSKFSIHFCHLSRSSRSAILVLVWDALMFNYIMFMRYFGATLYSNVQQSQTSNSTANILFNIGYCMLFFLFSLLGLIADMWTGRYKIIVSGIFLCFFAWILSGVDFIIAAYWPNNPLFFVIYALGYLSAVVGYSGLRANIVQFNVDQLVGASADELSAIIYWHSINVPLALTLFELGRCSFHFFLLLSFVMMGVTVSLVLITHSFFKHWLETTPLIINPIRLIAKVLNYARKNKYPRNRSALTYWEEDYPSRLDLGKEKYGGPFTEEEVENVKTVLRMIPLMICIVGFSCADEIYWSILKGPNPNNSSFKTCFISNNTMMFVTPAFLLLIHQFFIYPCFNKYIPSMLKRIGLGLVFALATTVSYVIIFKCQRNILSYLNNLLLIPQILFGVAFALIFPASLEFTIAQSPIQMRGMMVGMWLASFGVGYLININTKYPFGCNDNSICLSFYYYITKSVVMFIILLVFIVLGKWYKLRVRENEVNILQIVDEHYERYMDQKEEYERLMELSTD